MNVDSPVIPCCPRIYWRECRKNRRVGPLLPSELIVSSSRFKPRNWDSLPCLRLQPHNRILFICRRCGFGNTFGTTCPWCSRICEETTSCINSTPRIRRISCPSLLTDAQKAQLERIEEVTNHTRRDYCQVPNLTSVGQGNPGASQIVDGPSDVAASGLKRSAATPSTKIVRRKRHRNAAVYSAMDVVATGTAVSYYRQRQGPDSRSVACLKEHRVAAILEPSGKGVREERRSHFIRVPLACGIRAVSPNGYSPHEPND